METTPEASGAAGMDIGGTKVHMRFTDPVDGAVRQVGLRTGDFGSLDELLDGCFRAAGVEPRRVVAGMAGRPGADGDIRMTNRPGWPVFRRRAYAESRGIVLDVVNDMLITVAGVSELAPSEYRVLTPETVVAPSPAALVVAVGTGVGTAYRSADGAIHGSEAGHSPWQPVTRLEDDYLRALRSSTGGAAVSVEQAVSGRHGLGGLYDFCSARTPAAPDVAQAVDASRRAGHDPGPAITAAAVAGDACCRRVVALLGSVLGQFLRSLVLTCLPEGGSVWLMGSVLQAPGVADLLMADTPFPERFLAAGAQHADLLAQTPLTLVTDPDVAVKGAFALCGDNGIP